MPTSRAEGRCPDGILWIIHPKQTSGVKTNINRDTCWAAMRETGWRP
ncbi:MAG: hypothetical protein M3Z66_24040 [Chloroflexota bacterium]|nr:hypothetical protein [Chloroflexota bacterium]